MTQLINLTPHPVVFEDGRTLPKCDNPPRLSEIVRSHHVIVGPDEEEFFVGSEAECRQQAAEAEGVGRAFVKVEPVEQVNGVTVVRKTFDVDGCDLPAAKDGTFFVVPLLIAQSFKGNRDDLLVTNDPIRDDDGRITGCRSLARV